MPDARTPIMTAMERFCAQYPDMQHNLDFKKEAEMIIDDAPRPSVAVLQIFRLSLEIDRSREQQHRILTDLWYNQIRLEGFKARLDSFID